MIKRLKYWLLRKIANGECVVMNIHLIKGLYIDSNATKGGYFDNVNVKNTELNLPDVAYYFHDFKNKDDTK